MSRRDERGQNGDGQAVVDVAPGAGKKIIYANNVRASFDETLAKVRPQKTGAAGYQDASFEMHPIPLHRTCWLNTSNLLGVREHAERFSRIKVQIDSGVFQRSVSLHAAARLKSISTYNNRLLANGHIRALVPTKTD
jgi:hypothetical protein